MPGIESGVIQELDIQIGAFKKIIETAGNEGRDKLNSIKVDDVLREVPRKDGKVDQEAWSKLDEDKQQLVHRQLSQVCDSLRDAASLDGPKDPHHLMFDDYASNAAIIFLTIVSFGLMFLLLGTVAWQWNHATEMDLTRKIQEAKPKIAKALKNLDAANTDVNAAQEKFDTAQKDFETAQKKLEGAKSGRKQEQEPAAAEQTEKPLGDAQKNLEVMTKKQDDAQKSLKAIAAKQADAQKELGKAIEEIPTKGASEGSVLTMVILLGALGGSLHLVSSLFKYVGNRQFKRSWILYYLAMPLTGAGLAPIIYMLLRVGLINPSGTAADGSTIANLNLMAIYAFALLTGMFSRAATDKLGEVFSTFFKTSSPSSKDALGVKKPSADNSAGVGKTP